MSSQLLDWEEKLPPNIVIHKEMTKDARTQRVITYIESLYQQFQIDGEQYRTLIRLVNNINKEN